MADGRSGVLVQGHDPAVWAAAIGDLLRHPLRRQALSRGALAQASRFGWDVTVDAVLDVYAGALDDRRARTLRAARLAVS